MIYSFIFCVMGWCVVLYGFSFENDLICIECYCLFVVCYQEMIDVCFNYFWKVISDVFL